MRFTRVAITHQLHVYIEEVVMTLENLGIVTLACAPWQPKNPLEIHH